MSVSGIVTAAYLVSALLLVLSLAGLSRHEPAKNGNTFGIIGMAVALAATIWLVFQRPAATASTAVLILVPMAIGAAIGVWRALRVEMTGMPQLIAMLHSFVGLAAVLVGYNTWLSAGDQGAVHRGEVLRGVVIGAVTLAG